jgi:hypothetical protein
VEKYGRARQATDGNIMRRMRFACWMTKATDTHSEYVILIAFPHQEWLLERACVTLIRTLPAMLGIESADTHLTSESFTSLAQLHYSKLA